MSHQHLFGEFEHGNGLFAAYAWEMIKKLIERVAGFEIIQQCLHRHTGTDENRSSAENIGITIAFLNHLESGWAFLWGLPPHPLFQLR